MLKLAPNSRWSFGYRSASDEMISTADTNASSIIRLNNGLVLCLKEVTKYVTGVGTLSPQWKKGDENVIKLLKNCDELAEQ